MRRVRSRTATITSADREREEHRSPIERANELIDLASEVSGWLNQSELESRVADASAASSTAEAWAELCGGQRRKYERVPYDRSQHMSDVCGNVGAECGRYGECGRVDATSVRVHQRAAYRCQFIARAWVVGKWMRWGVLMCECQGECDDQWSMSFARQVATLRLEAVAYRDACWGMQWKCRGGGASRCVGARSRCQTQTNMRRYVMMTSSATHM